MIRLAVRVFFISAVLMGIGGVCRAASAQEAVPAPDTVQILSATAYWQIYDSGPTATNVAVLVRYDIDYDDDLPDRSLAEIMGFQLEYNVDGRTQTIMTVQPYPFNRRGYGEGVVGMFVPDDAEGLSGLTGSTPLSVRALFFPGLVTSAPAASAPVVWRNRNQYLGDLEEQLRLVEVSEHWSEIQLLDSDNNLTSDGIVYASNAIPYLSTLAPDIYKSRLHFPEIRRQAVGESYAEQLQTPSGAEHWRNQFNPLADWLGQPVIMVKTMVTIIIGLIAAWFFQRIAKSQLVTLPVLSLTLAGGALIGWVHMGFIGVLGFGALLVFVFVTVLKRAS